MQGFAATPGLRPDGRASVLDHRQVWRGVGGCQPGCEHGAQFAYINRLLQHPVALCLGVPQFGGIELVTHHGPRALGALRQQGVQDVEAAFAGAQELIAQHGIGHNPGIYLGERLAGVRRKRGGLCRDLGIAGKTCYTQNGHWGFVHGPWPMPRHMDYV
ncbi:hypothetical protein DBV10_18010 [Acidovorax sp. FJL06]|nr:hypothetical protein DBV10_18010 [Acidovorax sp. FJL06]